MSKIPKICSIVTHRKNSKQKILSLTKTTSISFLILRNIKGYILISRKKSSDITDKFSNFKIQQK